MCQNGMRPLVFPVAQYNCLRLPSDTDLPPELLIESCNNTHRHGKRGFGFAADVNQDSMLAGRNSLGGAYEGAQRKCGKAAALERGYKRFVAVHVRARS